MSLPFAGELDALSHWRRETLARLETLARFLAEHELADAAGDDQIAALRHRLGSDKLVVAFVAEFSRGKSELINAVLAAVGGGRLLPAAPGRTTMCPVELGHDGAAPASLALLPIESRLDAATLDEWCGRDAAWTRLALDGDGAGPVERALAEVERTQPVTQEQARELGLWNDGETEANPLPGADGRVQVPVWRHARLNLAHPLLRRGLVLLDTPGLNALGAEPELTLGLLPGAQATVLVLAADAGVTRSDLALWRDHLAGRAQAHYVVLNKIDALRDDPLLDAAAVEAQIEAQRLDAAATLGVDPQLVFALSARDALAARIAGDEPALQRSRLPAFEAALGARLLHQRRELLEAAVDEAATALRLRTTQRIVERRRQVAEQLLELRALRGKSGARLRAARQRVGVEAADFEQCVVQLRALRAVHRRLLDEALQGLAGEALRAEVDTLQQDLRPLLLNLNARPAFAALCQRLRTRLATAQSRGDDIRAMLSASQSRLNAEFGFALTLAPAPDLARFAGELDLIEASYQRYLGLAQALRLAQPRFRDQFRRMLLSRLRVVFESASGEIELWSKAASAQLDTQLAERRRSFRRRSEALERVELATGELEQRVAELGAQDASLQQFARRVAQLADALRSGDAELPQRARA